MSLDIPSFRALQIAQPLPHIDTVHVRLILHLRLDGVPNLRSGVLCLNLQQQRVRDRCEDLLLHNELVLRMAVHLQLGGLESRQFFWFVHFLLIEQVRRGRCTRSADDVAQNSFRTKKSLRLRGPSDEVRAVRAKLLDGREGERLVDRRHGVGIAHNL